jgi:hypothetical protein
MTFKIIRKTIEPIVENKIISHIPVTTNITVLEKYDGREISSITGCIAKDLFCAKINQITGLHEPVTLYIDDYILK